MLGGRLDGDELQPWEGDRRLGAERLGALEHALALAKLAPLAALGLPPGVAALLAQIIATSKDLLGFVTGLIGSHDPSEAAARVLPDALRELCRGHRAVCLLDGVDARSELLWNALAGLLAPRIATDLPVLLVLGLDGPRELAQPRDDEPEHLHLARELTSAHRDAAAWRWLAPLTDEQVRAWTGPATSDVIAWLSELTGGRSGETRLRWQDWQERRLIERQSEGRWRFAGDYDPALDIDGLVDGRIRALVGGYHDIAAAHRVLGCAALEGRQFTAAAVALAIERPVGDVLALLDALALDEGRPNGLLMRQAPTRIVAVDGERELAVYRFARELDWRVMSHHGLSPGSQRHHAAALVVAFQELYGEQAAVRADTLARLCEMAGESEAARHFERLAGINVASRIVLWRARNALHSRRPSDPVARDRLARHLVDGAHELDGHGPFAEGLAFARAAQQLASTPQRRADAVYLIARHLMWLADYDQARSEFTRAVNLYSALGIAGLHGRCAGHVGIAHCDSAQGRVDAARDGYAAALAIYREIGAREGEANVLNGIADCDRSQGRVDAARDGYAAALAICREIGARDGEASVLSGIADCDRSQGRVDAARDGYATALAIYREIGDRRGEANVLNGIAICDRSQGDNDEG